MLKVTLAITIQEPLETLTEPCFSFWTEGKKNQIQVMKRDEITSSVPGSTAPAQLEVNPELQSHALTPHLRGHAAPVTGAQTWVRYIFNQQLELRLTSCKLAAQIKTLWGENCQVHLYPNENETFPFLIFKEDT